jgi:UDP-2,3-diacylglucosamine pyrophosphatase LpxH
MSTSSPVTEILAEGSAPVAAVVTEGAATDPTQPRDANVLVISDLHLGEDLKPASAGFLRHVAILERELEAFLRHYTQTRRDGRPWELVINGDMVDFLSVCLMPTELGGDPDDLVYGVGARPHQARQKMMKVLERHPGVFRALARFVAVGNRVRIVLGNHDVEFHWPVVQEAFKEGVAKLAPDGVSIEDAITFHPWFFFRENLCWIEHGHQYDEYCSFDYVLNPVDPDKEEIATSLGGAGYRYISNHVAGADPHQQEDWNAAGYIRFSLALGLRGVWRMARGYAGMARRMVQAWRSFTKKEGNVEPLRRGHRERLRELAAKVRLSEETLTALDELRGRPVVTNLAKLLAVLMLDRVILLAGVTVVVLALWLALPWLWALGAGAGMVGVAWGAAHWLSAVRGVTDPSAKMRLLPERILRHVKARFVVFGHSHKAQAVPLENGNMYFNTGTWLPTEKPGLLRSFTHVLISLDADGGPQAGLFQWAGGKSRPFTP